MMYVYRGVPYIHSSWLCVTGRSLCGSAQLFVATVLPVSRWGHVMVSSWLYVLEIPTPLVRIVSVVVNSLLVMARTSSVENLLLLVLSQQM